MTNVNGKTYALAAIAPMQPIKAQALRLLLGETQRIKSLLGGLREIAMVHFARFAVISRSNLAWFGDPQPKEDLHYDYLIFMSNFNGGWNQYIETFSSAISYDLDAIAWWTEKFPGSVPVTPFKRWIAAAQLDTDHYYSAYPYATVNDIRAAHRVQVAFDDLAEGSDGLTPEQFEQAYRRFVVRVQTDLGATEPASACA